MPTKDKFQPFLTKEEASRYGKIGAQRSAKAKRDRRLMREYLEIMLMLPSETLKNGTNLESIAAVTIKKALSGDLRAIEFIRDTIGEKPSDRMERLEKVFPKIILISEKEDVDADEGQ